MISSIRRRMIRCFKRMRSEEHTSELQSRFDLVCRLLLEKKNRLSIGTPSHHTRACDLPKYAARETMISSLHYCPALALHRHATLHSPFIFSADSVLLHAL